MLRRVIAAVLVAVVVSVTALAQERLKPGDTFRDCPECPEMVVVPAGSFMMGVIADSNEENLDRVSRLLCQPQADNFRLGYTPPTYL